MTLLALPLAAQAQTLTCPFTDYFAISSPNNAQIVGQPIATGNLSYAALSNAFFSLSCGNNSSSESGNLAISIGKDENNKCDLTIHDGPYEWNPSVTDIYCIGTAQYMGMDHKTGSYNYTLKVVA